MKKSGLPQVCCTHWTGGASLALHYHVGRELPLKDTQPFNAGGNREEAAGPTSAFPPVQREPPASRFSHLVTVSEKVPEQSSAAHVSDVDTATETAAATRPHCLLASTHVAALHRY